MPTNQLQRAEALYRSLLPEPQESLEQRRARFDRLADHFALPAGTEIEAVDAGGVRAEWVGVPAGADQPVLVWFHGGGYCLGSPRIVREMAARIATPAEARALLVDYRLAPEHPHPAAAEDAVSAVRWLYDQGVDPADVVLGGDSAGGGLVLLTLIALRDAGDPLPAAGICVSPWTDLALTGESIEANAATDVICSKETLKSLAAAFCQGTPSDDPAVSPLYARLDSLPPLLVLAGEHEILRDDALRLAERAEQAGVDTTLLRMDDVPHVWTLFSSFLPEGAEAVDAIASFIRMRTSASTPASDMRPSFPPIGRHRHGFGHRRASRSR